MVLVDLYRGIRPQLYYIDGQGRKRIAVFKIAFWLLIALSIGQFFFLGQDIVSKRDPKVTSKKEYIKQPKFQELGPNTFNFRFEILDLLTSLPFKNESLFEIKIFQGRITQDQNYELEPLEIIDCDEEIYGETYYVDDNFKCINPNQTNEAKVEYGGRIESGERDYADIAISVRRCENTTNSPVVCAPSEEIDRVLRKQYLGIKIEYFTQEFDPYNYEKPTKVNPKLFIQPLSSRVSIETYFWMSDNTILSDTGFLTKEMSEFSYPTVSLVERTVADHENIIFLGFFQASGDFTTYTRTYIKLPDIFARVEGLMSIIILVIIFFLFPFGQMKYTEDMINNLYYHDEENNQFILIPEATNQDVEAPQTVTSPNQRNENQVQDANQSESSSRVIRNENTNNECKIESEEEKENSKVQVGHSYNFENCDERKEDEANNEEFYSTEYFYNNFSNSRASTRSSTGGSIKNRKPALNSGTIKININQNESDQINIHQLKDSFQVGRNQLSISTNNNSEDQEINFIEKNLTREESGNKKSTFNQPQNIDIESDQSPNLRDQPQEQNENQQPTQNQKKKTLINISFWDYLKRPFMRKGKKDQKFVLLEQGAKKLKTDLNIITLARRIDEVQTMKTALCQDLNVINQGLNVEATAFIKKFKSPESEQVSVQNSTEQNRRERQAEQALQNC